jgi:hypothetical protein
MDYNSPIYREKYLKYKKKYLELKAIEEQDQIAGGNYAATFSNMFKSPAYKQINSTMSSNFAAEKKAALALNDMLLKNIKQKKIIQQDMKKVLAEGYMTSDMSVGPVKKAIGENKDATKTADELLKTIYSANLKVGEQTFDNVQSYVDGHTKLKLSEIHKTLHDQVGNVEAKEKNKLNDNQEISATVEQIIALEKELVVEKGCKDMGVDLEKCEQNKIDLVKKLDTIIKEINKSKESKEKNANLYINTKKMNQKSMDELATELSKLQSGSVTAPVKDEDLLKMVTDNDAHLRKQIIDALKIEAKPEDISFDTNDGGKINSAVLKGIGALDTDKVAEAIKALEPVEKAFAESAAQGKGASPPSSPKANTSEEGKKEVDEKAKKEADEKAKKEADEKAKKEADEKAKKEADAKVASPAPKQAPAPAQ